MTDRAQIRRLRAGLLGLTAASMVLAACGGSGNTAGSASNGSSSSGSSSSSSSAAGTSGGGGSSSSSSAAAVSGTDPAKFTYLTNVENTTVKGLLTTLSTGACATQNAALPLSVDTVPQTSLDQKLQLLAGQKALPAQFAAGNAPALTEKLFKAGQVADVGAALDKLGVTGDLLPSALSTIKAQYGGQVLALPYEYNIEGIFYNKKVFTDNGVSVPGTWDELVAAAAKFQSAGIQAFSASGQQGWPITRLIGDYLYRKLGPNAMQDIASGKAKLTDPDYVDAAQKVADLGSKGYFGKGVGAIDYDTAFNTFLTGKAAMFYMGSWALSNIADPTKDKIGAANIGFMPFPAVAGGKGSIDQYPSNVGLPMTLGAQTLGPKVGDWVKCIAKNYGDASLKTGTISGFKSTGSLPDATPVATSIQKIVATPSQNVLWFEALFSTKATTVSQTNAAPLATGAMSAQQFMSTVQAALGS